MGDVSTNYKVHIAVDDTKWLAYVKSVKEVEAAYGGATKAAITQAQKAEQAAAKAADAQIKAAQKAALAAEKAAAKQTAAEIKAAEKTAREIEKEEEKKQKYLFELRKRSIAQANAAEIKANKEKIAQERHDEQVAASKSGGGVGVGGLVGLGAAVAGFKALQHHGKEADEASTQLALGLTRAGLAGEALEKETAAQTKASKTLANQYAVTAEETQKGMGLMATMTGKSGQALTSATEDAIILAKTTGQSIESVVKITGKATNEEIEAQATKLGIAFAKTDTAEMRTAKLHEAAMKAKATALKDAKDGVDPFQRLMNQVMTVVGEVAQKLLDALNPAIEALMPIFESLMPVIDPLIEALGKILTPIIEQVSELFKELAPPIIELVNAAMAILMPILNDLMDVFKGIIPVISDIVKTVLTALTPVFKELGPVIQEITKMFLELFSADMMNVWVPLIKDVFVPILTDLVVPIMRALIPIIKQIADIFMKVFVPAIKMAGDMFKWLMDNIIQPLIKYLSGTFVSVVNGAIGVVKDVIGFIGDLVEGVGDIIDFFSSDDEPKKAVQKQGAAVVQAHVENQKQVTATIDKAEEARRKQADANAKKAASVGARNAAEQKKSFIETQKALVDLGELSYNQAIENLQKYYDKLKKTDVKGRKEVLNTIESFKKSEFDIERKEEDVKLKQQELALLKEGLSDEDFREQKEAMEIQHLHNMLELAKKNGQDTLDLQLQIINAEISQQKRVDAEKLALAESEAAEEKKLAAERAERAEKDRVDAIESMKKQAAFFAGPLVKGFTNGYHKLMKGADDWANKMAESNNVIESIFGGILQGFLEMIEGMIVKIIEFEAILAVANLIPGFSGLMEAMGGLGALIPHADGGIIEHADGGIGVRPVTMGRHRFFEAGPEAVIPLSSGRAQGMMQTAFGFDKALQPVVSELASIKGHVAQTRVVLPMNNAFENARNNYLKSEDRRSI